ncbi:MAG TPA: glycosyltransferase family 4 protein [Rhodopila sp.]|uniref:glycosyltransferase family 4 protein n=1 Tax=Rhodopila sp. TaxID=2480087 RepID=UPI002B5890F0|nr:glycosyltransferase family 4 protein [Rhodopila sp.]HVY14334.1 glycosyltransferase family 4 protein [Rhodopila sp.]
MHVRLIAAATLPAVSGAAIYNRTIADNLRALGHTVDLTTDTAAAPAGIVMLVDGSALPAMSLADLPGAVALVHHPLSLENSPPDLTMKRRETELFAAVRHIVTTSQQTADRLVADFAVPAETITPIVPGLDALPRCPGTGGPTCQILCLAQLIPRKGQDVLLRALSRLFDLDWHLTIAGGENDPVYANGLRALAEELNIARHVTFHPEATGEALEALWRNTDLFALTSHYEGYGMVWAEALRRGLPVVATNTGAVPTLIGPNAGVVCAPGDVEQLSRALRRLIFDPALRRDMAEEAWQAGQALPSWRDQAEKLAAALVPA